MRDPARIDRILELLGKYWKARPDLRLGQLLVNLIKDSVEMERSNYVDTHDIFNFEDTSTLRDLEAAIQKDLDRLKTLNSVYGAK